MDLEDILRVAVRGGASDIILKTGSMPRFRFNGELLSLSEGIVINNELMQSWIDRVCPQYLRKELEDTGDCDFAYNSTKGNRFRVNLFRQRQTYGMVLRVINNHIKTIEELQLPDVLKEIAMTKRGLILVTGATGSGKSTTLASMIEKVNREKASHIITVEDPIEFSFKDARSTINQREIGIDASSFGGALRAALRQNPDVILVGELRDRETTETALMAAETGHMVMSTLHTSDATESLTRLMSYFEPHRHEMIRQMLAQSLKAVLSQRLVPRADGKGMVPALEIMVANGQIREAIKHAEFEKISTAIRNGGDTYGMQTFDQALLQLYEIGRITEEMALAQASNPADMELRMSGVGA